MKEHGCEAMLKTVFAKKYVLASVWTALLVLFTLYVLLSAFVIERRYASVEPYAGTQAEQGGISITLSEYRISDTDIYVADVRLTDAASLHTALAESTFGRNITEKTSDMAKACGARLAVNGDFYGARESGYVIRNGRLLRSASAGNEGLAILSDGSFYTYTEGEISAEELLGMGAVQAFSFGPVLISDGKICVENGDEVGRAMMRNPRTAIAIVSPLRYLFVVSDGRTEESEGLRLYQLAGLLLELGAHTAYNLDGGGSSAMYFDGELVNNPTTTGSSVREREVSDIVWIG